MRKKLLATSLLMNLLFIVAAFVAIRQLGGFRYVWYKIQHRGVGVEYFHKTSLFAMLPEDTSSIVFLGNSLTAQCEWHEFFPGLNIKNRGIPVTKQAEF